MYRKGDKVTLVDEVGVFEVIQDQTTNDVMIEDEHGFDRTVSEKDLVLFQASAFDGIEMETFENRHIKTNPFSKKGKKAINIPVIDLHIEHLLDSHTHMQSHEIVLFQLDVCQREIDKHIERGTPQFVIVHGIGKGKLKEEVRYLLRSYPRFEFMDEHYTNQGIGATKVFIK